MKNCPICKSGIAHMENKFKKMHVLKCKKLSK